MPLLHPPYQKVKCDASNEEYPIIRLYTLTNSSIEGLDDKDFVNAQLGLGHFYACASLKFNVNHVNNMIIHAIALLDQLDKDINLFAMRIQEWYGYHFPELIKLVSDNCTYAHLAQFIGNKDTLTEDELTFVVGNDSTFARNTLDASRGSISQWDLISTCSTSLHLPHESFR